MKKWIVTAIKTKCPDCGDEREATGEEARDLFSCSSFICPVCGFEGELPE